MKKIKKLKKIMKVLICLTLVVGIAGIAVKLGTDTQLRNNIKNIFNTEQTSQTTSAVDKKELIKDLETQLSEFNLRLNNLSDELDLKTIKLEQLQVKLDNLQSDTETNAEEITLIKANISELNQEISSINELLSDINDQIDSINQTITGLKNDMNNLVKAEVIYYYLSSNDNINWGYTNGIGKGQVVTGKNFNNYDFLIVSCGTNLNLENIYEGSIFVDLHKGRNDKIIHAMNCFEDGNNNVNYQVVINKEKTRLENLSSYNDATIYKIIAFSL